VRIVPTTTPFNKGMLGVTHVPVNRTDWVSSTSGYFGQLPTEIIDASSSEVVEFSIPWTTPLPKRTNTYGFDSIALWVMSPLASDNQPGIAVSVPIQVQAAFVNPRLYNQVPSGGLALGGSAPVSITKVNAPVILNQGVTVKKTAVAGKAMKKNGMAKEAQTKAKQGLISSSLATFSGITAGLSILPGVGSIASGLSLAANIGSKIASAFGYSKPPIETAPMPVFSTSMPYRNTFSGLDTAEPLSCDTNCLVATDPGLVGSSEETLDIYEIAKVPSFAQQFQIPIGVAAGSFITSFGVNPCVWYGTTLGAGKLTYASHVGYIASFFKLWTGGMTYKFVFPSTVYQSVTIAICWTPLPMTTYSETVRQEQFTINKTTTVNFNVPWEQPQPYLPTRIPKGTAGAIGDGAISNGYISVFAINPITNTQGANLAINAFVYCAASESTRFAVVNPISQIGATISYAAPQGFGQMNEQVFTGLVAEDNVTSLRELAKLPGYFAQAKGAQTFALTTMPAQQAYITGKFTYFRGAFNVWVQSSSSSGTDFNKIGKTGTGLGDFHTMFSAACGGENSATIPFTLAEGFDLCLSRAVNYGFNVDGGGELPFIGLSFCDDLSLGFLGVSPPLQFS